MNIKQHLYFYRSISANTYSDIPSQDLVISRLLNGQKPFRNVDNAIIKEKKTLVICGFDISPWKNNQLVAFYLRLKNLMDEGFQIVHFTQGQTQPFNLAYLKNNQQFWGNAQAPDVQQISRQLDTPVDEFLVFDESFSKLFVQGDEGDWDHLVSLDSVPQFLTLRGQKTIHQAAL